MIETLLVTYLVNAVWQIPLIAIGAALLSSVGGLEAVARHRVWLIALALAVILPILPAGHALTVSLGSASQAQAAAAVVAEPVSAPSPAVGPMINLDPTTALAILAAAALAAGVTLLRLFLSWRAAMTLAREAVPASLELPVSEALANTAARWGVPTPAVKVSQDLRGPAVVGDRRPTILVPRAFARLPHEQQSAALLHELAHVRRRDFAMNLACEAIALPACWHPVTYEIKAGVRRSCEIACDAMASTALGSREAYARRLISLADSLRLRDGAPTTPVLVSLIGRGDLEDRLLHILRRPRGPSAPRILAGGALAAAVLAPAFLLHVNPAFASTQSRDAGQNQVALAHVIPAAETTTTAQDSPPSLMLVKDTASPASPPALAAEDRSPVRPLSLAQEYAPPPPPAPPAPPAPPPAPPAPDAIPPAPPAPPAPPPPPSPPSPDFTSADQAQIAAAIRRATEASATAGRIMASREVRQALAEARVAARQALDSAEVRQAMTEARVRGDRLSDTERQAMRRQMTVAMQTLKSEAVRQAMDEAHQAMDLAEVRRALADARAQVARAAAEAAAAAAASEPAAP